MVGEKSIKDFWNVNGEAVLKYGRIGHHFSSGVGSNTYRVFKVKESSPKFQPSKAIEKWAKNDGISILKAIDVKNDYSELHKELMNSLKTYWETDNWKSNFEKDYSTNLYPYAAKIIDLFVKHQAWMNNELVEVQKDYLVRNAFQPLDRKSLGLLRKLGVKYNNKPIPNNATMGFINDEKQYLYFQEQIKNFLGTTPLFAFDFYAWNILV